MTTIHAPIAQWSTATQYQYIDYGNWWQDELSHWVPERIFDAHVHLGPPQAMAPIVGSRVGIPLTTYSSLTWRELKPFYGQLYSGKTIDGLIAFPFPMQEVDYQIANDYIADLVLEEKQLTGFILANPLDTQFTISQFYAAQQAGARFLGVKPYYDLLHRNLTNSVQVLDTADFVPDELLEFMDHERLILMLHTCSIGMGDPECQRWVRRAATKYPNVKIVLAHMGRYFEQEQFFDFFETDLMDYPSLFLETSDGTATDVYAKMLTRPDWCKRLVFGSDMPFALFTAQNRTDDQSQSMAYNTYHVINALKTALENSSLNEAEREQFKADVFLNNARERLLPTVNP